MEVIFSDAIKAQDAEKVKFLLINAVNPYVSGIPILLYGVEGDNKDVIQAVLDSGKVSVNSSISDTRTFFGIEGKGWSALHAAAAGADKKCTYAFWVEWRKRSLWSDLYPDSLVFYKEN